MYYFVQEDCSPYCSFENQVLLDGKSYIIKLKLKPHQLISVYSKINYTYCFSKIFEG